MNFVDAFLKAAAVLLQAATTTATGNATGVDVESLSTTGGFDGPVLGVLATKAGGSGATLDAKLQHSDTQGGTYTDVTNGAFTQQGNADGIATVFVDGRALKKFVRVANTIGGTASFVNTVSLIGIRKYT